MLYDRRWDKQTKTEPSLEGFIAWLETKDPNERYDFYNRCGKCVVGQYMSSIGIPWTIGTDNSSYKQTCEAIFGSLHAPATEAIIIGKTFGGCLARLRAGYQ